MSPDTLSLVLAALVRPGLQFSPGENEIPDDNNIVTLNKYYIDIINVKLVW